MTKSWGGAWEQGYCSTCGLVEIRFLEDAHNGTFKQAEVTKEHRGGGGVISERLRYTTRQNVALCTVTLHTLRFTKHSSP